jgi:DNA-binding transcriptional ArsR family regulator
MGKYLPFMPQNFSGESLSELSDEEIASKLKGNTLRVYWALLRSKDGIIGVREVQRLLKFSSPALASYHLSKLEELGLVKKENGDYRLIREVKVGVLKQFTKIGSFMLPRYTFYASMLTTLLVFYLTQFREVNFYSIFALIFGGLSTAIMWYETIRTWLEKP